MGMIQGIDGMALINAMRAGRQDRYADQQREQEQRALKVETARKEYETGLVANLLGGTGQRNSLAENYAPSNPQPAPSFDSAFSPQTMQAFGGMDQGGPAPQGLTGQQRMPQAPMNERTGQQPQNGVDPQILQKLLVSNPERWTPVVSALKNMGEMETKRADARNMAMAQASHWLETVPLDQRLSAMHSIAAPFLAQAGWSEQELNGAQLTDSALRFYQSNAVDMDKLLTLKQQELEFQAGKIVTPQPGAGAFNYRPDGTMTEIISPNDGSQRMGTPSGGGTPVRTGPRQVTNAQDYANIPPGASYMDPQGNVRQKPGGPTPNASGTFRP